MVRDDDVLEIAIDQFADSLQTPGQQIYAIVDRGDDADGRSLWSLRFEKNSELRKITRKRSTFRLANGCRTQLTHRQIANDCASILAPNETVTALQLCIDHTDHQHTIDFELQRVLVTTYFDLLPLLAFHRDVLKHVIVPGEISVRRIAVKMIQIRRLIELAGLSHFRDEAGIAIQFHSKR